MNALRIKHKGRSLAVSYDEVGFFRRGTGLMFRSQGTSNLLFRFAQPCRVAITSWFVFFPFVAVWLDSKHNVIETRVVKPFILSFKPRSPARYLLELPLNRRNLKITRFLVGK